MVFKGIAMNLAVLAISCLIGVGGCGRKSDEPLAAGSRVAYTTGQSKAALRAMQSTLGDGSSNATPISLVPADGIRWSDLSKAIAQAGAQQGIEVAVAGTSQVGVSTQYALLTIEGWPGVLKATPKGSGIVIVARIGPYPNQRASRERAARLVNLTHQRLLALGRIPKVEPYTVE